MPARLSCLASNQVGNDAHDAGITNEPENGDDRRSTTARTAAIDTWTRTIRE